MVPLTTLLLIVTSKVMVATFAVVAVASARITPAVVFSGALIKMPDCNGSIPGVGSVTVLPLSVVLPAT